MTARRNMTKAAWAALNAQTGPGTPILTGQVRRHPFGATVTVTHILEGVDGHARVRFAGPSFAGSAPGRFVQTWELVR